LSIGCSEVPLPCRRLDADAIASSPASMAQSVASRFAFGWVGSSLFPVVHFTRDNYN